MSVTKKEPDVEVSSPVSATCPPDSADNIKYVSAAEWFQAMQPDVAYPRDMIGPWGM